MNLEQLKKQASLDQKLLIEKVETLVRSEYNRDDMLAEIRQEYISRVGKRIIDIMPDFKPYLPYGMVIYLKNSVITLGIY